MVAGVRKLGLEDLCVHQVCLSGQCDFASSLEAIAGQGIRRTALWNPMLEEFGEAAAADAWAASGLAAESLCFVELFAGPDNLKATLDRADRFGARTLVLITGGVDQAAGEGLDAARARVPGMLAEAEELARPHAVRLAFEPLHPMACGNRSVVTSLAEALALLGGLGDGHRMGLAIDSYALWWETDLDSKLAEAGDLILNYHVSDWLADTGDLRLDRGMPGDGLIDLPGWRRMVERAGYLGPVEVEIFSRDRWWKKPPETMLEAIVAGMNRHY